jgi:ribosomal protein L14
MTVAAEFLARVTGGKLPTHVYQDIARVAEKFDGKVLVVSVKERKRQRSLSQNSYYFGVVVKSITRMFREAGNYVDEDEVHEFLKQHVGKLSQNVVTPDGEVLKVPASTKRLSTMDFELYLDKVRAWAAELGCMIPLPNETLTEAKEGT